MFLGEYHHNLDDKGRLAIPAKFRVALSRGAVVTRGLDNCLFILPKKELERLAIKLAELPLSQSKTRAYARHMLAGAMESKPDKQGRIVIPDYLQNFAKIKKSVVVAGLYNRIEVWDKTAWERYAAKNEKEIDAIAEALGEFGI